MQTHIHYTHPLVHLNSQPHKTLPLILSHQHYPWPLPRPNPYLPHLTFRENTGHLRYLTYLSPLHTLKIIAPSCLPHTQNYTNSYTTQKQRKTTNTHGQQWIRNSCKERTPPPKTLPPLTLGTDGWAAATPSAVWTLDVSFEAFLIDNPTFPHLFLQFLFSQWLLERLWRI